MAGLKGQDKVLRNLKIAIDAQRTAVRKALMEAALIIKRDSVMQTPIDYGNLRSSAFVMVTKEGSDVTEFPSFKPDKNLSSGKQQEQISKLASSYSIAQMEGLGIVGNNTTNPMAIVAYGANYSLYVHEMPGSYNFNSGNNKFLERAFNSNKSEVQKVIKKKSQVDELVKYRRELKKGSK